MYRDPLHADEMGNWHRPHKQLPSSPEISDDPTLRVTLEEIKQATIQFRQWSKARNYDPYFCAGETMAAFCALIRRVNQRVPVSSSKVLSKALIELEDLHKEIVLEMIDDSDGLHLFGDAQLENSYEKITTKMDAVALKKLESMFNEVHDNW